MTIDSTISSTISASIQSHSYFSTEVEVLFSTHTVFRVEHIFESGIRQQLFDVWLKLTIEDDPELGRLTDCTQREISGGNSV